MKKRIYSQDSEIYRLYKHIWDATKREEPISVSAALPMHNIQDIIIPDNGIELKGNIGYSWSPKHLAGNMTRCMNEHAEARFIAEPKVPRKYHEKLLVILVSHYGEPTDLKEEKLIYEIKVGKRTIEETYFKMYDKNKKITEDIIVEMILGIDLSSFV